MTDYALPSIVELLATEDLATLRSLGRRKVYADGETLHMRGDEASMGVVVEGVVRLYRQMSNGQRVLTASMTPGQHFGDILAFGVGRRTHTGIAASETIVDHYDRERFHRLLEHPGITRALYITAAHRLTLAIDLVDDIRSLPPEVRLAKTLAMIQRSTGGGERIECLQEDMANLLGISAVTVAKAFKVLRGEGLLETGYRYVTIPDAGRLKAWIEAHNPD